MAYGIEINSTTDNSLLLSSEAINSVFLGKATYNSLGDSVGVLGYVHIDATFTTPDCIGTPVIFLSGLGSDAGRYRIKTVTQSSNHYIVVVTIMLYGSSVVIPTLYCFGTPYNPSINGSHGLQLRNSSGTITYDSRWERKLLTTRQRFDINNQAPDGVTINSSITKPAWCWNGNTIYVAYLNTSSPTDGLVSLVCLGMPQGSTKLGGSHFPVDYFKNAQYVSSYQHKFFPSNEMVHVEVIDGSEYD